MSHQTQFIILCAATVVLGVIAVVAVATLVYIVRRYPR